MLSYLLGSGDIRIGLISALLSIPSVLIALSFHEFAHGFSAHLLGDPTAERQGRLTLNPLAHLDPIGAVVMLLFGFGWAKPVPINVGYFKNRKLGMALTTAAGPLMNFLLGIIGTIAFFFVSRIPGNGLVLFVFMLLFQYFALLNFSLGFFNLIPLPPFDGSRILFVFLPDKIYFAVMKYERIIMIVFLILLWSDLIPFSTSNLSYACVSGILNLLERIF